MIKRYRKVKHLSQTHRGQNLSIQMWTPLKLSYIYKHSLFNFHICKSEQPGFKFIYEAHTYDWGHRGI